MATRQTVYVADREKPIWDAAERIAKRDGVSLSRVVAEALADHLPRRAAQPDPADRWAAIAADAA
jgi:hypothetical protein